LKYELELGVYKTNFLLKGECKTRFRAYYEQEGGLDTYYKYLEDLKRKKKKW